MEVTLSLADKLYGIGLVTSLAKGVKDKRKAKIANETSAKMSEKQDEIDGLRQASAETDGSTFTGQHVKKELAKRTETATKQKQDLNKVLLQNS